MAFRIVALLTAVLAFVVNPCTVAGASDYVRWAAITSGTKSDLYGLWGSSASDVFCVGKTGTVLRYDGKVWSVMTSGTGNDLFGVWGSSPSNIFAVGSAGTVLHYDGKVWSVMTSGTGNDLFGVWGSSANSVFAVGRAGTIMRYDGKTWAQMINSIPVDLYGVWGTSEANVFAVGGGGMVLRYDGRAWAPMSGATVQDLFGVWGSSDGNVFAVGRAGTIIRYDGKTWAQMSNNTPSDLFAVWGSSGTDVFAVGKTGVIMRYNAESWEMMTNPSRSDLFGVWGTSSINVLAVGMSGAILQFAPPVVTAVSPSQGTQGETLDVTVDGRNLTGVSSVTFGSGIAVNNFRMMGLGQLSVRITVVAGAAVGPRDISVTTPYGVSTLSGGFTVKQALPVVASVTPDYANQEASVKVIISGANLGEVSGVTFGEGITVDSFAALSPNQVIASITVSPDAVTGVRSVSVTTPGGTSTLTGSFTVKQALPAVASVSPDNGARGATLDIIIGGKNFNGATEVKLGAGVAVNRFVVVSPNEIAASITIIAGATTGARDVSVVTPGGISVLAGAFTVKQGLPVIASISPSQGSPGDTLDVLISGSNLDGATAVSFGSEVAVNSLSNRSPTQVAVRITISRNAAPGPRDVNVTTEGGTGGLTGCFIVKESPPGVVFVALVWAGVVVVVVALVLVLRMLRRRRGAVL